MLAQDTTSTISAGDAVQYNNIHSSNGLFVQLKEVEDATSGTLSLVFGGKKLWSQTSRNLVSDGDNRNYDFRIPRSNFASPGTYTLQGYVSNGSTKSTTKSLSFVVSLPMTYKRVPTGWSACSKATKGSCGGGSYTITKTIEKTGNQEGICVAEGRVGIHGYGKYIGRRGKRGNCARKSCSGVRYKNQCSSYSKQKLKERGSKLCYRAYNVLRTIDESAYGCKWQPETVQVTETKYCSSLKERYCTANDSCTRTPAQKSIKTMKYVCKDNKGNIVDGGKCGTKPNNTRSCSVSSGSSGGTSSSSGGGQCGDSCSSNADCDRMGCVNGTCTTFPDGTIC